MSNAKINWFKGQKRRTQLGSNIWSKLYFLSSLDDHYYLRTNKKYIEGKSKFKFSDRLDNKHIEIINSLNKNGVAVANLSDFFTDSNSVLDKLNERFDQLSANRGESYMNDNSSYNKELSLNPTLSEDPDLANLVFEETFSIIGNEYLELIPRFGVCQEFIAKPTVENKRTSSRVWHRDGADKRIMKVFVYLNDVSAENGPFEYIKGTHFKGAFKDVGSLNAMGINGRGGLENGYDGIVDNLLSIKNDLFFQGVGKKGSVIFADTSGIHRGGHCVEGERRMIHLAYYTNAAFLKVKPYSIESTYASKMSEFQKVVFGLSKP